MILQVLTHLTLNANPVFDHSCGKRMSTAYLYMFYLLPTKHGNIHSKLLDYQSVPANSLVNHHVLIYLMVKSPFYQEGTLNHIF